MSTPTYPLATLAYQITPAGVSAPLFNDILASINASVESIYGSDVYETPAAQDQQFIGVFAKAMNDANQSGVAGYNGFSPATASGAALASRVKYNGIKINVATNSTVTLEITGTAGTLLPACVAQDAAGNLWNLPANVTIPAAGVVLVTAVAQNAGAIVAAQNTIVTRYTPTLGWQGVTNPSPAVAGSPVESDAALRLRQAASTSLASVSPRAAIVAAVASVPGVTRYIGYENDTHTIDANGISPNTTAIVVLGGDITQIANAIAIKKAPGTGTYGSTTVQVTDAQGMPLNINFSQLTLINVYVTVTIQALAGYVASTGVALLAAVVAYINNLNIAENLYYLSLIGPATLYGSPLASTYHVTGVTFDVVPNPTATTDIMVPWNAAASTAPANVTLVVT